MDCESIFAPVPYKIVPALEVSGLSTPSAEDVKKQKQQCEKQLELQRKQYHLDDVKNTVAFTLVGLILFAIHFPLARKNSRFN